VIANGGSYRCASWWANHLQSSENDRAQVVKSYGLRSENILDMLREMEAFAKGTRCENFFYQANLNPLADERLTPEQWDRMREIAEKHHGFEGQAYFVVEHVKNGRVHHHIVWSRIDLEEMRAIPDSHDARRNHAIAREIEQELGLERVTGPYDREPGAPRPKRAPEPWEMYRGMKTGLDPRDIAAEVTELFHQSDSGKAFQAALEQHDYMLLKGDRRGFLILDSAGKEHSLARRLDGVNTKELNAFMGDVDREALPTVEVGKALYQERKIEALEADRATVRQELQWEEALGHAAIEKEKRERRFVPERAAGKEGQGFEPLEPPQPEPRTSPRQRSIVGDQRQQVASSLQRESVPARDVIGEVLRAPLAPEFAAPVGVVGQAAGKIAEVIGTALESLIAPVLTPEQRRQGEIASRERQADAAEQADFSRYTSDLAFQAQQHEEEREAMRKRERDDRER
jgi:hypothetical protein